MSDLAIPGDVSRWNGTRNVESNHAIRLAAMRSPTGAERRRAPRGAPLFPPGRYHSSTAAVSHRRTGDSAMPTLFRCPDERCALVVPLPEELIGESLCCPRCRCQLQPMPATGAQTLDLSPTGRPASHPAAVTLDLPVADVAVAGPVPRDAHRRSRSGGAFARAGERPGPGGRRRRAARTDRPVRRPSLPGRGRFRPRLRGARRATRPPRGAEGGQAGDVRLRAARQALPPRGPRRSQPAAPQHCGGIRLRPRRDAPVHRQRLHRRTVAGPPAPGAGGGSRP